MGVTTSLKPLARYSLCGDRDRGGGQLSPTASLMGAAGTGRVRAAASRARQNRGAELCARVGRGVRCEGTGAAGSVGGTAVPSCGGDGVQGGLADVTGT